MAISMHVIILFWSLLVAKCNGQQITRTAPQQIHLSATANNDTQMMVTWSTFDPTESVVEYGHGNFSKRATGYSTKFVDQGQLRHTQYIHRVLMTDLVPGTTHIYHCGSSLGWSDLFFFTALQQDSNWSPRFAVYGDMGNENAQSLGRLQQDTQNGMYDAILHVGDFAYNMFENNGTTGDSFMRQIESVAAYLPYMTCPGNHEFAYNFSHYKNRFTMPNHNETLNLWYSWNIGPAHIVSFSTEVYFFALEYGVKMIKEQLEWLEADLQAANQPEIRSHRPWIITMAHRPTYCTENDHLDCEPAQTVVRNAFENLLYKYGVDLQFWAHEHIYERLWPVYNEKVYNGSTEHPYTNPKAPVSIITGSAGCRERHSHFGPEKPWSAFRSADYGYTRMNILNFTHINFQQVSDDQNGRIIDEFTLIKEKHGPEAWL